MKAHKVTGDECTSLLAMFWRFNVAQEQMTESQRLKSIQAGFMPSLYEAVRFTFQLQDKQIEVLLSTSISALERLRRHHKKLDLVASERLDRIASVSHLATAVFEDKQAAIDWLSRSNEVLGDQPPVMLCETEIGAKQIRRVLHAMEWGGAA